MKVKCVEHNNEASRCSKCRPHLKIRRYQLRQEKKLVKCTVEKPPTLGSIETVASEPFTSNISEIPIECVASGSSTLDSIEKVADCTVSELPASGTSHNNIETQVSKPLTLSVTNNSVENQVPKPLTLSSTRPYGTSNSLSHQFFLKLVRK